MGNRQGRGPPLETVTRFFFRVDPDLVVVCEGPVGVAMVRHLSDVIQREGGAEAFREEPGVIEGEVRLGREVARKKDLADAHGNPRRRESFYGASRSVRTLRSG
jgi:hypothetical protein